MQLCLSIIIIIMTELLSHFVLYTIYLLRIGRDGTA